MIEFEIYRWDRTCSQCEREIPVVCPRSVSNETLMAMDVVGRTLAEEDFATVEYISSDHHQQGVWGNVCPHCNTYQDNRLIRMEGRDRRVTAEPYTTLALPMTCMSCGGDADGLGLFEQPLCENCLAAESSD